MQVKDGKDTTELRLAIGGMVAVILMALAAMGTLSQDNAETLAPIITNTAVVLITAVPVVIGWIVTTYNNSRRDIKTSANKSS